MRRIRATLAFGLAALLAIVFVPGQPEVTQPSITQPAVPSYLHDVHSDSTAPRFVIMDDYIREYLAKEWDKHLTDTLKLERGYCLRWQYDIWAHEKAYRITQIAPADSVDAQSSSISFVCPKGKDVAEIHIHPAQTCINGKCWDGGPYAWQCLPSDTDREYLVWANQPFGMVQCTREGSVFYFPLGDNR